MTTSISAKLPFNYDCAVQYESNNGKKLGLLETDNNNNLICTQTVDGNKYKVYPLIEVIDTEARIGNLGFTSYGYDEKLNLKELPCVILDMRNDAQVYIDENQMINKIPILLIHIKFFVSDEIMYRQGMNGIYGIEKVYNDDGRLELINESDFSMIRRSDDLSGMAKFDTLKSAHNNELEIYSFRHSLIDSFESVLRTNSSRSKVGKFTMSNVSAKIAKSLFAFMSKSLDKNSINSSFQEFSYKKSKDIIMSKTETVRDIKNTSDTIVKVNLVSKPLNTIALDIPYPSILRGYLSNYFFKFPAGLSLQRSGIGCLDTYIWDYIPVNNKPISFSYNFVSQILQVEFSISSDHNKDIDDNKTHMSKLKEYENSLLNTSYYDHIFGWNFVVKFIEFNNDLFNADKSSNKKSCFLAWGIKQDGWNQIPPTERGKFLKDCADDKYKKYDHFIPYEAADLNAALSILHFQDEDAQKDHIKTVRWWHHQPNLPTLLQQKEMTTNIKNKLTSSSKSSCSKKPKLNIIALKTDSPNEGSRSVKKLKKLEEKGGEKELVDQRGKLDAFLNKAADKTGVLGNDGPNMVKAISQLDMFMSRTKTIIREDLNEFILHQILDYYTIKFWKSVLPALFNLSDADSIKLQSFDGKHLTSFAAFLVEGIINETFV